jgi:2-hydroxychromene-2-carboxylate isomerase
MSSGATLHEIDFWFDPISPYAFLAFHQLPQALEGFSVAVTYRPVLFAAFLKHYGQLGPAEIAPKRDWTYRDCLWQAHAAGIPMQLPAAHPFNSLALLRLGLACAPAGGQPNRYVCERILAHVWQADGADATAAARLEQLRTQLQPARDPDAAEVRHALRAQGDAAIAQGLFGVPTLVWQGRAFWGAAALPMLRAALQGDAWFDGPAWEAVKTLPSAVERAR